MSNTFPAFQTLIAKTKFPVDIKEHENSSNFLNVKKVYAIVITYNGAGWINKCLDSLRNSQLPCEIQVIDNGSTDETCEIVSKNYPDISLLKTNKNLGFGQANNIGIIKALESDADYVFLLNQDAWVKKDTLGKLISDLERHPLLALISPIHLNGKGDSFDKYFYDYFVASGSKDYIQSILMEKNTKPDLIKTSFVNAAAWMLRTRAVEETGGFDPLFFHYGEDKNYCQRLLHNGWEIGISTSTAIYHDREARLQKPLTEAQLIKKEKIEFLTHAADIRKEYYLLWIVRRFIAYGFNFIVAVIKNSKQKRRECWNMLTYIPGTLSKIRKSRQTNRHQGAHL